MKRWICSAAAILVCGPAALAGDVSGKGPNGGRIGDAATMHVEFLSKGTEVFVYTYDHSNKPVTSAGMTGRVTIQEKGKLRTVDLRVAPPNGLVGSLDAPLETGARVVVSVTKPGGKPEQARYTAN